LTNFQISTFQKVEKLSFRFILNLFTSAAKIQKRILFFPVSLIAFCPVHECSPPISHSSPCRASPAKQRATRPFGPIPAQPQPFFLLEPNSKKLLPPDGSAPSRPSWLLPGMSSITNDLPSSFPIKQRCPLFLSLGNRRLQSKDFKSYHRRSLKALASRYPAILTL
jgi:hypothetical protein